MPALFRGDVRSGVLGGLFGALLIATFVWLLVANLKQGHVLDAVGDVIGILMFTLASLVSLFAIPGDARRRRDMLGTLRPIEATAILSFGGKDERGRPSMAGT